MRAGDANQFVGDGFVTAMLIRHNARGHRFAVADKVVATQKQYDEELSEPARGSDMRDQVGKARFAFVWRTAPGHKHWHYLNVYLVVFPVYMKQFSKHMLDVRFFGVLAEQRIGAAQK